MYSDRTLFSQVMDFVPWTSFDRIVVKYGGDIGVRTLRCTEHFRVMAFAQTRAYAISKLPWIAALKIVRHGAARTCGKIDIGRRE